MLGDGRRGDVERLGDRPRVGVAFCTCHYAEPRANALTSDALDPEAGIPGFKHSVVAVEPVTGRDAGDAD